jgi:hypothetical protein
MIFKQQFKGTFTGTVSRQDETLSDRRRLYFHRTISIMSSSHWMRPEKIPKAMHVEGARRLSKSVYSSLSGKQTDFSIYFMSKNRRCSASKSQEGY